MPLVAQKVGAMSRYGSGLCNTFIPSQMPRLQRRRSDLLHRKNRLGEVVGKSTALDRVCGLRARLHSEDV